jgi:WD40 repeat protein
LADILISRLDGYPELGPILAAYRAALPDRPRLANRWPLPDRPHPALRYALTGHTDRVGACAISPDGATALTTSWDGTARVWDLSTGTARHTLTGHTGRVVACAISPDGATALTTSDDGTARVWDLGTGTAVAAVRVDGPLTTAAWPQGTIIYVGGHAGLYAFSFTDVAAPTTSTAVQQRSTAAAPPATDPNRPVPTP